MDTIKLADVSNARTLLNRYKQAIELLYTNLRKHKPYFSFVNNFCFLLQFLLKRTSIFPVF